MTSIKFKINGKEYEVNGKFGPDVSLNEYIRTVAELRGTKAMCHEGGCGACIVSVRAALPPANVVKTFAVNSGRGISFEQSRSPDSDFNI